MTEPLVPTPTLAELSASMAWQEPSERTLSGLAAEALELLGRAAEICLVLDRYAPEHTRSTATRAGLAVQVLQAHARCSITAAALRHAST